MRVLVADTFEQSGLDGLAAAGCEVVYESSLKDQALVDAVLAHAPEVLVVRSTKVPEAVLAAGPLELVVRAGAGYNTIDVAAASRLGIYVANCPGKNSIAVAELAFGLITALDRRIADNVADLRAGVWNKAEYSHAKGLYGRTLGLIGVGGIGSQMIPRAKGFGMPVVAWSPSLTAERAAELGITSLASPEEVAAAADVVSVHVALNDGTRGLLGGAFFDAMRPEAFFINTSRGEVVDEVALADAIRTKGLRAGLDVYAGEPSTGTGEFAPELASLPGVYGTHHIGASTDQAQEAIAAEAVRIVRTFAQTGTVPHAVNLAIKSAATSSIVVRHLDRPGTLAHTLDAISAAGINVQEMENTIFDGAVAAVARISVEGVVEPGLVEAIKAHDAVIDVTVIVL
ncbi:MAG: NAD(P)-dependent oxidoreductase [Propionicimonas sp.]|uniref:NAD(P)-dependent oxidoreductase n=1 Tax=Propionicimonas sp. TaxID=1955623 RepID=UPI003D0B6CFC